MTCLKLLQHHKGCEGPPSFVPRSRGRVNFQDTKAVFSQSFAVYLERHRRRSSSPKSAKLLEAILVVQELLWSWREHEIVREQRDKWLHANRYRVKIFKNPRGGHLCKTSRVFEEAAIFSTPGTGAIKGSRWPLVSVLSAKASDSACEEGPPHRVRLVRRERRYPLFFCPERNTGARPSPPTCLCVDALLHHFAHSQEMLVHRDHHGPQDEHLEGRPFFCVIEGHMPISSAKIVGAPSTFPRTGLKPQLNHTRGEPAPEF